MKKYITSSLSNLEKRYNKLPHPIYIILYCIAFVTLVSYLLARLEPVLYEYINPITLEVTENSISVNNALSFDGYKSVFLNTLSNFSQYPIMMLVFITMLGFGIVEKSELLYVFFKKAAGRLPKIFFTYFIVIIGVLSNILSPNINNAGYIVLLPISAFIFMGKDRNPLAGIATAFASIFTGYQLNIVYDNVFVNLQEVTEKAASLHTYDFNIPYYASYIFMIILTIAAIFICVFVTEKIIVPFCKESKSHMYRNYEISKQEKSAVFTTLTVFAFIIAIYIYALIPKHIIPSAGFLIGEYDPTEISYLDQFIRSPFVHTLAIHISLIMIILGVTFGLASKKITKSTDIVNYFSSTIAEFSEYFVIIFFFSQLIAVLNVTRIPEWILVKMLNFFANGSFEGLTLIVLIIGIAFIANFLIPSSTAKWAYMAPVIIPTIMTFSFSPSLGQLAYIIGDTSGNIITPFMPYTIFAYALFRIYGQKTEQDVGIGTALSLTIPYTIGFIVVMFAMLALWITLMLPLGDVSVYL